jgi:malate synthase
MQGETKQLWEQLCEQAAVEQDPEKFFELIKEINRLLEERRNGLENSKPVNAAG